MICSNPSSFIRKGLYPRLSMAGSLRLLLIPLVHLPSVSELWTLSMEWGLDEVHISVATKGHFMTGEYCAPMSFLCIVILVTLIP